MLKVCPNCKAEFPADSGEFCKKCGTKLSEKSDNFDSKPDDDLEFVVTETPGAQIPDVTGISGNDKSKDISKNTDNIEITSESSLLEESSSSGEIDLGVDPEKDIKKPDIPEFEFPKEEPTVEPEPEKIEDTQSIPSKLSAEELAAVKKNLYGTDKPPAPKPPKEPEPVQKAEKVENEPPAGVRAIIEDPSKANPNIKKAQKVRGLAHFRGNSIKLVGNPFLHEGDEIQVNDKPYLLKPKKYDKRVLFGAAAAFLVIVFSIIAIQIARDGTLSGDGEIVGMILDDSGRPFLEKARVSIPSLNKTTMSNAQGFFIFQKIPTGTYELVFELNPDVIYHGNATVTSNQLTLMAFSDLEPMLPPETPSQTTANVSNNRSEPSNSAENEKKSNSSKKKEISDSGQKSSSSYGKIKLNANVEDARLIVDGKILGAGNNTYTKIKSGSRKIEVTKDGYKTYSETVRVKSDKTVTVSAKLSPEEPTSLSGKDYLSLGKDALAAKDYQGAIDKLSEAIKLSPSLVDAYESRATAYKKTGATDKATNDYVRAGEISRFKKDYTRSITDFTSALSLSDGNTNALVGRGDTKFAQGDYRAAMEDYDSALRNSINLYGAQYGMAKCYFKMGEPKKAEKYFKAAHELDPSDPELYQYMMLNYLARDDIKKVREMYAEFKVVADPAQLAEFKSSSRYEPILRLISEEDR
jgi:tetratricopeptide (TPR) repeat protein